MSSKYKCHSKEGEELTALEILEGNKKKSAETITRQKEKPAENSCAGPWWEKGRQGNSQMERIPDLFIMRPRGQWCGPIKGERESLLFKKILFGNE